MNKNLRKRIQALLLAAAVAVTALGSVTTVTAQSSASTGSLMDFSFPFDFLFFHFEEEEETMTEEDLETERDRLREQSMKAEEAAGLNLVYEYTMETPEALSTLDLSGCEGSGTFEFAEPEFIPEKGVSVCEFIFTPDDVEAYEYELMLGWDEETQTLRRYAEVICSSLVQLEEDVTDGMEESTGEESVIPDAVETTPEVTPTPDAEEVTPEVTPIPDAEEVTPEITPTPGTEEATPEVTPTPDAEESVSEPTPTPEIPEISKPGNNLIPEITTIPELAVPTPTPEATPTPEPVITAPINPGSSVENGVQIIEKDDMVKAFEAQVLEFSDGEMTEEQLKGILALTTSFDALSVEQKNAVSSDVMNKLTLLQDAAAEMNHSSNGVTVSGNVPWFVQLRVSIGNDTDTYVPTGLETIVPYDMCLWNMMTDSEYILSGGEKVTLTMAVPENIHLYDGLTIVHYMDETHYEYIELKISGDTMSFETASFSPFNVAGSTILVGGKPNSSAGTTTKPSTSGGKTDTATTKPSTNNSATTKPSGSSADKNNTTVSKPVSTSKPVSNSSNQVVKTGDMTNASQFVMLGMGALVMMALCVIFMKYSKREDV